MSDNTIIPKATELEFNNAQNAPAFTCAACGKTTPPDALIAEIEINGDDGQACIVVCNDTCKAAFIAHPAADSYIEDFISRIKNMV